MNPPVDFGSNIENDVTIMPEGAAKINPPEEVVVPEEGVLVRDAPVVDRKSSQLKKYKKRVWIVLEDNDNIPPTGQFIGHDGVGFMLRAGVPAEIPVQLLEILNHAEYLSPVVDQASRQIIDYKPRLRFPYRIVAAPKEAA